MKNHFCHISLNTSRKGHRSGPQADDRVVLVGKLDRHYLVSSKVWEAEKGLARIGPCKVSHSLSWLDSDGVKDLTLLCTWVHDDVQGGGAPKSNQDSDNSRYATKVQRKGTSSNPWGLPSLRRVFSLVQTGQCGIDWTLLSQFLEESVSFLVLSCSCPALEFIFRQFCIPSLSANCSFATPDQEECGVIAAGAREEEQEMVQSMCCVVWTSCTASSVWKGRYDRYEDRDKSDSENG